MAKKKPLFWFEEPADDFRRMQENFFSNMKEVFKIPLGPSENFRFPEIKTRIIPIRLGDADTNLILRAELPGFSKDEINIKVKPKTFYIDAEKKKQSIERDKNSFRMEKGFNSFSRVISLPEEIKTEEVKAKFCNGILEVSMPKKETKKKEEKDIKIY